MTGPDELLRALWKGMPVVIRTGIVTSVDEQSMTCTVEVPDQAARHEVRLRAAIEDDMGFTVVPAQDSTVLIGTIDNMSESCVVLKYTDVQRILLNWGENKWDLQEAGLKATSGKMYLQAGDEGFVLKRDSETLLKLLSDTIDAIVQITVPTGTGPSGTPVNSPAFNQIKSRLKSLFKE